MTALKGALEMISGLHKLEMSAEVQKLLDIALRGSSRMMLLINDLLTIGKMQANEMAFNLQNEDLCDMLEEALAGVATYRNKTSFTLSKPPAGTTIRVDRNRFQQIMANLFSNAAKFSPQGATVVVSGQLNEGKALIAVKDSGSGIPQEFQNRIFQKYAQAECQQHQGTGLGLHITKNFVEKMSGQIWFESVEHSGTTFYLAFPLV